MLRGLLACLLILMAGCSVTPLTGAKAHWQGRQIGPLPVPFFPQEAYQCGPAALASVLVDAGINTLPDMLTPQVYLPGREGSLAVELVSATRRQGRVPILVQGGLDGLLSQLEAQKPVLVFQNLGFSWLPRWHYAVVTGWDGTAHELVLHSGLQKNARLQLTPFLKTWARANEWALVAYVPGQLPPQPVYYLAYLQELPRLEKLGFRQAARDGYAALLPLMPESPIPGFALGNLAYAEGDARSAERYWREVLGRHPQHAPTLNNLAEGLLASGRANEALPLIRQAASLDASPAIQDTLARVEAAALR